MTVESDLTLDVRQAIAAAQNVGSVIDEVTRARLLLDTSGVAGEIQAAVDAADTDVAVTVSDVDTSGVAGEVETAVDAADTTVTPEVDTAGISDEVETAVDGADTTVTPEFDSDPIREGVEDGLGEGERQAPAKGSATGGAFARSFSRAVTAALQALPDVEVGADSTDAQREIAAIRGQLLSLADQEIGVDISGEDAARELSVLQDRLDRLDSEAVEPTVRLDIGQASAQLSALTSQLSATSTQAAAAGTRSGGAFASAFGNAVSGAINALPDIAVGLDSSEADRRIAAIRDALVRLSNQTVGVTISSDAAAAELAALQGQLDQLDSENVSPTVSLDLGAASAQLAGVTAQLDDVDDGLQTAAASGANLRTVLAAVGVAGAAKGLFETAQAASDLAESTSKATVVFGQGIGEVQAFADTSAQAIGLSEQAALEATGTFGNLFTALGATKAQATELSPEVVTLAADLASFNNLNLDETLEKLRSGLVGEIEPLRSLGISFGAAEVDAKAMELGLADANGEVSEGAKLQARWALILEQSTTAQGDFSRTSEGLANQQRILSAEFQNSIASLGEALLPALLDAVSVARDDVIPAFQELGEGALPALAESFVALLPLAGGAASILSALGPVLETVAGAIKSVPPELIQLIGLFVALKKLNVSSGISNIASSFAQAAASPGKFAAGVKASAGEMISANAGSFALTAGLSVLALAFSENEKKAAEFQRQLNTVEDALEGALKPGVELGDAFEDMFDRLVDQGGTGASILAELGLTAEQFSRIMSQTDGTTEDFANALGLTTDELGVLKIPLEDFTEQLDQASKAQVTALRSTSDLGEAYVDQVIKANTTKVAYGDLTTTTVDYVSVLATLTAEQARVAEQIGVTVDETGALVEATGPAADAADRLGLSLAQVRQAGGDFTLELQGLAIAAGDARIAEEDLQDVADQLGVSLDDLKVFVGGVNDAINTFADNTLDTLPTVGDLIGDLGDEFSPEALLEDLQEATEAIADFSTNIEELASFPRLQQVAAENGPLVAAALAQPIKDGNTQIAEDLEAQLGAYDLHYAGLDAQLRNEFGPQIADATGVTAQLASEAFGSDFTVADVASQASRATIASIEDEDANMTNAAEGFGKSGTSGFSTGVSGMPTAAATYSDRSTAVVNSKRFASALAGRIFGGGFSSGTGSGASGMPSAASDAANAAITAVKLKQKSASAAGASLGTALAQGMQAGINAAASAAANAAAALVEAAIAAARAKAKTGSPSKLFAELGVDMADGVVVGLEAGTDAVAAASAGLVDAASFSAGAAAANVSLRSFSNADGSGSITVDGVAGMVQINVSGAVSDQQAIATGRAAARGWVDGLLERQVATAARVG